MKRKQKEKIQIANTNLNDSHLIYGLGFKRLMLKFLLVSSLLAGTVLTIILYYQTRFFAVTEAEKKINELLLQQKSIHDYITNHQKPEIYRLKDNKILYEEYFSPQLLSGSYIARNIHSYYNQYRKNSGMEDFYYKLAATNPRNPINQADEFEQRLIDRFNSSGEDKYTEIIKHNGIQYLYVAFPFLPNSGNCMRCHGKPDAAPKELIEIYGDIAGFYEEEGNMRAITSIRVPLEI